MSEEYTKEQIKNMLMQHIFKKSVVIKHKNKIIDMIMTQTTYDYNEAIIKLALFNYNYVNVIRDYLKPMNERIKEVKEDNRSLQQKMMGEIRHFMDTVASEFEKRKEK